MFEAHVLHLLRRYLGEYVHGLSAEALRISVWKGDVVLKDLNLKAEALNSLKLPVTVKAGFVGTITLKVPWKSLGKEPVIVLIDRVFILAHPAPDGQTLKDDWEKLFEAKLQHIEEAESAILEAKSRSKHGSPPENSWLGSIIATIIGNLKISISNVHIRYEDSVSNPGHPFASGITLARLAAVTMDEQGNEIFDTSGALDKLRKSLHLQRLALYHNSNSFPWKIDKRWEDLTPTEWIEIFEDGINETAADSGMVSSWALNRKYLVSPINGMLQYHRLGNQEKNDPEIPFEKASLVLTDVSLTITEEQYHDWIKMLEVFSRHRTFVEVYHLRPSLPVSEGPHLWWRYAVQASFQQKKMCYRFSWDKIQHLCQLRRRYVQLYSCFLQQASTVDNSEIREIEEDLDSKVILLWRLIAHAKVESVKSKEETKKRQLKKKSWFRYTWLPNSENASVRDAFKESQLVEESLTNEEWQTINKLLSYQPDEELMSHSGKDMHNMTKFLVTVSIGQAAARIMSINETEILCGRFEQLHVSTKFKHCSTHCDILLKFYGLSSPEGSLAESVSSEKKVHALVATFVRRPVGENVDWRLSATISPCHVTVLMRSFDKFFELIKRSNAISPTIALETATALQMKFEKVTRRAQEQFQMVLEEQSSFALDIDLDAPKVRVPIRTSSSSRCDSYFLLDFGHFTLHTMGRRSEEHKQNIYSRFYISGRDIAAFFIDGTFDAQQCTSVIAMDYRQPVVSPTMEKVDCFYSLIDRCGMAVVVDQIKVPHPSYPSTRVSIQVPNLGVHFSPERYLRLMELLNLLKGTMETYGQPSIDDFQANLAPWCHVDLAIEARILVWTGIGNSVAAWQPCFLVLSGLYLYVLDSEKSQNYQRYMSMAGRHVFEIPPINIGGSPFCIAISCRRMDNQKALESSTTLIIKFREYREKATWLKELMRATYQASAPPMDDVLSVKADAVDEFNELQTTNLKTANLVIDGALVETTLFIYGKSGDKVEGKLEETLILEVLADGGKVHLISLDGDLGVKMKLHSLKIKDALQDRQCANQQYLAYSVLKKDDLLTPHGTCDTLEKETSVVHTEEDDTFTDALPEFLSVTETDVYSPKVDTSPTIMIKGMNHSNEFESAEALIHENDLIHGKGISSEIFYEAQGCESLDFVSVAFSMRSSSSPDYQGVDMQMSIHMSKLAFFCNRPTLVALIGFGFDLRAVNYAVNHMDKSSDENSLINNEKREDNGRVKGLLGYGKDRVMFHLTMNVDTVSVFLNKEDGSQLAMFMQESFLLDFKVYPIAISIDGTLGNFRLCDMSLGADHCWGWFCDIRNPGVESLIKFKFDSFNVGDDDYEGYDYSLSGRLSGVRIVFLYRFVQEISAYFMELATPHSEEVIKLVDKVGGFEWLIKKYEMDGASALKLDLSLDTPIIIVPRNSVSKDFIQLELGELKITNEINWHGSSEKDPSAVHIDVLHAEITGVNMFVGINGSLGKPMIQDGQGLDIFVRRSLRDVFRKLPTFSLEVKVGSLHVVMSDKEYDVILNCTSMNLNEAPNLPASFRGSKSDSNDTMRMLVDRVNLNSQILLFHIVSVLAVEVEFALLELCTGIMEELPLAHVALEGFWVSYRMTSSSERDLYVTIPKFSIMDIRLSTKPEMRLMLGSSTDASKQPSSGKAPFLNKRSFKRATSEVGMDIDVPVSTMLLMDYRCRASSQSYVVRVQQPRVLVVPDFLLAVGEFFVPALGTITGRDDIMDPKNDPISRNHNIVLNGPVHLQSEDVVHLSPSRQLIADVVGVEEYTYDGCGKTICLNVEKLLKDFQSAKYQPIIIIGRGKRLRFINVKIENGSLLRNYTYLSNDSSYSVAIEDGVDISVSDNFSIVDDKKNVDHMPEYYGASNVSSHSQSDSKVIQSLTFEAQVVSPELVFYDGTKSSLDDSLYSEKLLCAKMDLSFRYVSKENDTWTHALLKDLTIEAGSGLIILDPVDISGGYTSCEKKMNMSLISTDVCLHLSLGVLSLLLNLHSQAATALQFGNMVPLASCTNFNQIWMSPKENGSSNNVTIWRPEAPSNYVILGDCVTSRSIPPSQAVMAVSNTYGRVRKPIGFNFIGLLSRVQGIEGHSDVRCDCSLWMPVAPPGYTAMGCVANVGDQPPLNHIVYCLRSDLVTSTTFSECIFSAPSNPGFTSGFSIWRMDNVLGSFYAHSSIECPSKGISCDLNHLLLWNSIQSHLPTEASSSGLTDNHEHGQQQTSTDGANSYGWDVVRSISKATSCYTSTHHFERIWWDKGSELRRPVSIWRPITRSGYAMLGDCVIEGLEPPDLGIIFKSGNPEISAKPVQFTKVSHIVGRGFDEAFFWYPVAPSGYASLGCVVSKADQAPSIDLVCCPRIDIVKQVNIVDVPISRSSSSKASQCWSIWKVENQGCTFLARSDLKKPISQLAYTICDSVKPKTRENVTAEVKLRHFSLTVLDSLCGMMTPLFDTTITNIRLSTHGLVESMNASLICSIAASTFNTQLESWEPLVESFDGIFKFETYDTSVHPTSSIGKRVHVAATNILNINVSAANVETFVEAILSWRRQLEFEQKTIKLHEETDSHFRSGEDTTMSVLNVDDFKTVIVENKLGCDIYLKKVEEHPDTVAQLHHGDCASVCIPPPRFSNRLNVVDESREARCYIFVQIMEAKGLPIIDDGNSHNFFCALRLVVDSQVSDQQKLFPQSARTKCVKPLVSEFNGLVEGTAKWNELFIFEIPRKGLANVEVEVTNLAAKAGKGEVVGALSFPVGHGVNMLKKVGSTRMLNQSYDVQDIVSYSLRRKAQPNNDEDMQNSGHLFVSNSYFERKTIATMQRDARSESHIDREVGFWVGLHPDGAMKSIRSLLPLSVVPKSFDNEFIAMEVIMKNGKKHAIFRGLVTVVNDSDFTLGISVCHTSFVNDKNDSLGISNGNVIVEEVFENQYFQPNSGWGDKRPGSLNNGPGHWSTNVSYSSNEFFEPPLPPGWCWTSAWTVAKSQLVDDDGWAYGPDHQSLKWPLMSSKSRMKSVYDVMRRRRWIRIRQQVTDQGGSNREGDFVILTPGSSAVLPWRFTFNDSNHCLQILPIDDESSYTWARAVAIGSSFAFGKDQALVDQVSLYRQSALKQGSKFSNLTFMLNQLEKKDLLFCCSPSTGSKQIWLSVGADASVLHTELNTPVYDWRISINSPLKLENRLPCPSEFTVWEKTKEGCYVERQHGIIPSRGSEHIYAADVQRPLYLTLFAQGGWVLEKDPVLVLDLSSNANISSFWMFHKQSKRRLRVNIERDMGGSTVAPKTIRFFVPYWIINDSSLPLAYRVVEIESSDNAEMDSNSLSRAVKSARTALKNPTFSMDRRQSSCRRNIQVVEVIEDTNPVPSMLSPHDSAGRSGVMLFQSQKDAYVSPRVGIAVAIRNSEIYDPGISLLELEKKERVDVTACSSDGSYYKLSAVLNMTSDRTKVVHFQPQTLFVNRVGLSLCLQQCDSQFVEWIHPTDPPKPFRWHCSAKVELLKLRVRGYKWSTPFSVSNEGAMCISLNSDTGSAQLQLRVAVRGGTMSSRYEVIFRLNSFSSPYRIENCSMFLPIRFRQVDGTSDSWRFLLPNSAASFLWEDLGRRHLLELVVDGADISKSEKYDIDEIFDHQPNMGAAGGPAAALRVTILKEERTNVVKITDWMPENEPAAIMSRRIQSPLPQVPRNDSQNQQSLFSLDCEFHVIVELAELGISIVDHTPEEILYLSVQNVLLAYSTGLGSGFSRFKFRLHGIQVDNQLPLTLMPVLFRPQRTVEETDYILKFWFSQHANGSLDLYVYPNIGFFVPENCAFLINIHEPVIWRLHEMIQQVNIHRLYDTQRTAVSVDPFIQIGALNISEIRFKVSMTMSPSQRPRGVLGFWSSLMTALGNTENMTVRINQRFHENMCMRQSTMTSNAIANMRKDLLGQPLQLLSGLDILGNASSALGHMSKGVAALSMDKKFILNRQESKGVEDFGDFIREGGGALAKGLFRGVTGILTKPLEGAKSSGVEGFVQGVGKGIIGAAAQPVSGVLDLLSKTTEGANAMRMKIASAIASDEQLLRRRLPRAIGGDNLLYPYDEYKAQGQVILQLAESGSFFGQVDLFKVRGKFALSDAYEDHFLLHKGRILMITHRRVILLQQPSNIVAQRKFSPARDPCSILWDVLWDDLITMELTHGKKDNPKALPSRVILYLHIRSTETKEQVLVIKCSSETHQALEVYSSIERARNTYGNNLSKAMLKKKVMKPYTPLGGGDSADVNPKEGVYIWSSQQVPRSVPFGSSFGSSSGQ